MTSFIIRNLHIFLGSSKEGRKERGMWYVWGRGEVHTGFLWGTLMERNHLEDSGFSGKITLKKILKKSVERGWTGLI